MSGVFGMCVCTSDSDSDRNIMRRRDSANRSTSILRESVCVLKASFWKCALRAAAVQKEPKDDTNGFYAKLIFMHLHFSRNEAIVYAMLRHINLLHLLILAVAASQCQRTKQYDTHTHIQTAESHTQRRQLLNKWTASGQPNESFALAFGFCYQLPKS